MNNSIVYRTVEEADMPQLVELMNAQYSRKKNESYFAWQYFESCHPTVLICAFHNLELIGMYGMQEKKLRSGARAGQAIDMLVAPGWRHRGIFRSMGKKAADCFEGLDILCVMPNLNGKIACEKALGWNTVSRLNVMVLNTESSVSISSENQPDTACPANTEVEGFYYNREIRRWRYDLHPDYRYHYVRLDSGEFAVTKIFRDPVTEIPYGDIVDFDCNLHATDRLAELFSAASKNLIKDGIKTIMTWALPHTSLHRVLESMGFREMPQERYLCVKINNKKYSYLNKLSSWHLVQADAEIY